MLDRFASVARCLRFRLGDRLFDEVFQLVIGQLAKARVQHVLGECRKQRARPQRVMRAFSREPGAARASKVLPVSLGNRVSGRPEDGIAPGTLWADVPADWACPECGVAKTDFEMVAI